MRIAVVAALAVTGSVLSPELARANDSFAEVAAGGIKFLKQADIVLQKEVLSISGDKVEVAYRFLNPTSEEIVITVAFPLPSYSFKPGASASSPTYDFSVTTDGSPQTYKTVTEARLRGKDVASDLQRAGLPLADFRGWEGPAKSNPTLQLSAKTRKQLVGRGLLDADEGFPLWTASVSYVWEQHFPAGRVTEIKHVYTPQTGKAFFSPASVGGDWSAARLPSGCTPSVPALMKAMRPEAEGGMIYQTWVAYILTTANNWKTPIGEFTLVVLKEKDETVVLCSDLPPPRVTATSVEVSLSKYVPSRDLVVYFLAVHSPQEASQAP